MTLEIHLTQGQIGLLDDEDKDLAVFKWHARKDYHGNTYYVARGIPKQFLHKIIAERILGRTLTDGEQVDHLNRNGCDNRRENIRVCSGLQNMRNRGKHSNNTSGYKGVTWDADRGKWKAQIESLGHVKFLGHFSDAKDAANAYDEAAIKVHGEFASLNFPK